MTFRTTARSKSPVAPFSKGGEAKAEAAAAAEAEAEAAAEAAAEAEATEAEATEAEAEAEAKAEAKAKAKAGAEEKPGAEAMDDAGRCKPASPLQQQGAFACLPPLEKGDRGGFALDLQDREPEANPHAAHFP